ncbi:hypothetical protein [Paenibacillus donghaensis]|uniref:Uncharacterized protein n=1 Tax=Paenibacillus donghaensis TaxID=414771 RepID=A0A2Z2KF77_9BACL|nr:hypothetical protein [Paenibacillus donghaensis]ASA24774.1 hypothetical protein B9T62_30865 [Paenibacillus donghaensis]
MGFEVINSYKFDALNFLNVLTQDEFYVSRHTEDHHHFVSIHTDRNHQLMSEIIRIQGGTMLSPFLNLVVSSLPNFDELELPELFRSTELLQRHFSQSPYYKEEQWKQREPLFSLVPEILQDLEKLCFREYWQERKLPQLLMKTEEIKVFASRQSIFKEINDMLGPSSSIDHIQLYLCSFAAPHGIKITGPRYISDCSFSLELTLGIAIHEMFHPPYRIAELEAPFHRLSATPALLAAFEKQKNRFGYTTIESFIEENVVEAMALYIWEKIGLEPNPFAYLEFLHSLGGDEWYWLETTRQEMV